MFDEEQLDPHGTANLPHWTLAIRTFFYSGPYLESEGKLCMCMYY